MTVGRHRRSRAPDLSDRSAGDTRVALVTGTSSGFGRAIAAELGRRGHRVYGTSRDPQTTGSGPEVLPLEITDDASAQHCIAAVIEREARLDVLVNNAGSGLFGAVEDTSLEEVQWQLSTNFLGAVRMTKAVLPVMRTQGSGRIITISSMAGLVALPYQPFYSASKFAVEGFIQALRVELAGSGIDACTVAPGDCSTGFTAHRRLAAGYHSARHGDRADRALAIQERGERNGSPPELIGTLVADLVERRRLRPRYLAGPAHQRLQVAVRPFLPARWYEHLVSVFVAPR
jgi:NAD(P)-dependent dehydrogenase (short-subunit alcohol dehydrogenase family)